MSDARLLSFLESKGIYVLNEEFISSLEEDNFKKQIDNIIAFQKSLGEYKENLYPRIGSVIGKEINSFNSQLRLISSYYKKVEKREELNSVDFYFIRRAEYLISIGKRALELLYTSNYRGLIENSMKNYEVCLSRVDEKNLYVREDGKIIVKTIRYLSYNLKEHDVYSYIKKLKRKNIDINFEDIINYYVETLGLENNNREYLRALASYPNEEFRILERYILGKLKDSDERILSSLERARKYDSKGLVI
ncbi:hypothetical protein [Clostridium tertium]|uniref:Spore coat protein n=1 Tax=Clostridium tertium TaxID=1559 RepID=A0A6N3CUH9_9CLOT